jgi:hypothetical protein
MNNLFVILLLASLTAQHQSLFQPNSTYLPYGQYRLGYFQSAHKQETAGQGKESNGDLATTGVRGWRLIPFKSVAVHPKKMLIGSVLFIPQLVGMKMPSGLLHDGYVLAHDVLDNRDSLDVHLFMGTTEGWPELKGVYCDIYRVHGIMASTMRHQYRLQYQDKRQKQTYEMTWKELQQLMQQARLTYPDITKRIQFLSARGVGTPYVIFNLGEGGNAPYDPDPPVNFSQTDCMTFCEHTLALAISETYQEMFHNLQLIRYKEGIMDIRTRNHYTLADWLPNNKWLVEDVTRVIGGSLCKKMSKIINRRKDFAAMGIPDTELSAVAAPQELVIVYIPEESLLRITDKLAGGEIVSIISNRPGIFSAHMGIVIRDEWNNLIFRHGSSIESVKEVVDVPYTEIVDQLQQSHTRIGMVFMRVKNPN